jgi:hypothetical protein
VRELLADIDPHGAAERMSRAIERRTYYVPFVNSLWHIDGHHKLMEGKIVIHAAIDGKTHTVVCIAASPNNRADTVNDLFLQGTAAFGWPSRVRADYGKELLRVRDTMHVVRGTDTILRKVRRTSANLLVGLNRGSFIQGPSNRNQRIERLWLTCRRGPLANTRRYSVPWWKKASWIVTTPSTSGACIFASCDVSTALLSGLRSGGMDTG